MAKFRFESFIFVLFSFSFCNKKIESRFKKNICEVCLNNIQNKSLVCCQWIIRWTVPGVKLGSRSGEALSSSFMQIQAVSHTPLEYTGYTGPGAQLHTVIKRRKFIKFTFASGVNQYRYN